MGSQQAGPWLVQHLAQAAIDAVISSAPDDSSPDDASSSTSAASEDSAGSVHGSEHDSVVTLVDWVPTVPEWLSDRLERPDGRCFGPRLNARALTGTTRRR